MDGILAWAHGLFDDEPWARPPLIGRAHVPRIDDHGRTLREPELAVLSAVFHGPHERGIEVASAAAMALRSLPRRRRQAFLILLQEALPEDVMREVRKVSYEEAKAESEQWFRTRASFQMGLREGRAEGRCEALQGMRNALVLVLELRGLEPTAAEQARIDGCDELDLLARWCQRAKTAGTVADMFDDRPPA
ncbi:MAG TPA: hypothetical protein VK034_00380 [Enhygromyxa sp.]|nr:hypothetical protein [Enhygromyxa sp.]